MSESLDPLESELSALRPLELSSELRRRIAERLAEVECPVDAERIRGRRPWRGAVAGGLIAAGLAVILFRWFGSQPIPAPGVHQPSPSIAVENSGNMLLAYERAFARSPDEFDALLDKNGAAAPNAERQPVRIRAFSRSDPDLHALLGED
jgi:hypothetical protein